MNNFTYDDGEDVYEDATEGTTSNQTMYHWFNHCSLPTMTNYVQYDDDDVSFTSFCTCLEVEDDLLDEDNISSHNKSSNTHVLHTLWHSWVFLTLLFSFMAFMTAMIADFNSMKGMLTILSVMSLEMKWSDFQIFLEASPVGSGIPLHIPTSI